MSSRRGASGLSGILLVDKPAGMTSHDVVNRVRRASSERRVGHAGTLDPMATGLLVVLVGPATRLAPFLSSASKAYAARIEFGTETDTDDADGRPVATKPVPPQLTDPAFAEKTVAELVGAHLQVPPAFSAIKRDGVTSYDAARKGEAIELEAREIEVIDARLLGVSEGPTAWDVELSVSKGTYIRAIARDLGRQLGTAAHLSALRRTQAGRAVVEQAHTLEDIQHTSESDFCKLFASPLDVMELPVVYVNDAGALRIEVGGALDAATHCAGPCPGDGLVSVAAGNKLLAVYEAVGDIMKPVAVIPGGVESECR